MFLVDTMVISETGKHRPHPSALAWLKAVSPELLYLSVVTFGEIAEGIERKRLSNPTFSERLDRWADETRRAFFERTLPVTTEVALCWGALSVQSKRRDMDLLIAATAIAHDLTIVTRNTRHFEVAGVRLHNPYEV